MDSPSFMQIDYFVQPFVVGTFAVVIEPWPSFIVVVVASNFDTSLLIAR